MTRQKAPIAKLHENVDRIINSIAYVIKFANSRDIEPTQYDIVKTLFLADRAHLNKWGRPITYDNYCAMKHGPVPSVSYNILKDDQHTIRKFNIQEIPWKMRRDQKVNRYFCPNELEFEDVLSPSDMRALENAFSIVSSLGFSQIRKLTHEDVAYVDAWEDESNRQSFDMSLALLFDTANYDEAERIAEQSEYV
ncbi:MAG: Panacea domain-containing protein [Paracoccaceae bacterium]